MDVLKLIEEWRDIKGFEGLYQVSSFGRIKSLDRIITKQNRYGDIQNFIWSGRIMTPCINESPYYVIYLCKNNKRKRMYIHRIVAEAFINNPNHKPCVNHIYFDRHNNKVSNLEWVTQKENIQHSSDRMCVQRKTVNKTTGYKYIGMRENKYRVSISFDKPKFRYDKSFRTIEEAIENRDKILKIIGKEVDKT